MLALAAASLLGGAGCGAARKPSAAPSPRAAARWRSGLVAWNHEMRRSLDEISLLLSTQQAVESLGQPHSKLRSVLRPFERTLAGCSATVERRGPEPPGVFARGYALAACAELERGETLVALALSGPNSSAVGTLGRATAPLSAGQSGLAVATRALVKGYAPRAAAAEPARLGERARPRVTRLWLARRAVEPGRFDPPRHSSHRRSAWLRTAATGTLAG